MDESIHNLRHACAAIEASACGVINIKLGRVGGRTEASRIQAQAGFIWPGDVSASQRYWEEDIIEPEVEATPHGTIRVPTSGGLGYRIRERRIQQLTVSQERYYPRPAAMPIS